MTYVPSQTLSTTFISKGYSKRMKWQDLKRIGFKQATLDIHIDSVFVLKKTLSIVKPWVLKETRETIQTG